MLNPPNPLEPSHPRGALKFQDPQYSLSIPRETLQAPRLPNPLDRWPSGVGNTQSAGLTGESLLCKTFEAGQVQMEPKLVFLMMSFHGDGVDEVEATVRQECESLGFRATRVDDHIIGSNFVIKQIWQHIEKAELIVCDLTYERPNVYYELGYAHGVGNSGDNILLIARKETTLHFDVGSLGVHYYSSMEILRTILQKNLPAMHDVTMKHASTASAQPVQTPKKRQSLGNPNDVHRKTRKPKGRH